MTRWLLMAFIAAVCATSTTLTAKSDEPQVGRYQVVAFGASDSAILVDTATGRVWTFRTALGITQWFAVRFGVDGDGLPVWLPPPIPCNAGDPLCKK